VSEIQSALNVTSLAATTNTSNASIKSDELEALEIFVGDEMVAVRGRIAITENDISKNVSALDAVDQAILDINEASIVTNNRIDATGTDVSALDGRVGSLETRATTSENDISTISGDVTTLTTNLDALGDDLDNESTLLDETKLSLENFRADWDNFNTVAFVGDSKLNVTSLSASNCKIALRHGDGSKSAINFAGMSDVNWGMYLAKAGSGRNPAGDTVAGFGDVSDYAIRMNIGNSNKQGVVFENKTGPVASLSSTGIFQTGPAKCGQVATGVAGFGHQSRFSSANIGFKQGSDGTTVISAGNNKLINFYNNGTRSGYFDNNNRLILPNKHASAGNTVFSHHSDGNNYIRSASAVNFGFGANETTTVVIKNKEINIDGTNMLAELKALKTRVSNLEAKNYVLNGQQIYLLNQNNQRYLRKASSSNDGIIDTTTRDTRSRFKVVKS